MKNPTNSSSGSRLTRTVTKELCAPTAVTGTLCCSSSVVNSRIPRVMATPIHGSHIRHLGGGGGGGVRGRSGGGPGLAWLLRCTRGCRPSDIVCAPRKRAGCTVHGSARGGKG